MSFIKAVNAYKSGSLNEARTLFIEALRNEKNVDKYKCLYNIAVIDIAKKEYSKALKSINRALEYEFNYEALFNKAYCYYKLEELDDSARVINIIRNEFPRCVQDKQFVSLEQSVFKCSRYEEFDESHITVVSMDDIARSSIIEKKLKKAIEKGDEIAVRRYENMLKKIKK